MRQKIHFTSLGCSRNLVDTEVMLGIVSKVGYEIVDDPSEADFLVINTCGFLEEARQEAFNVIENLFSCKKDCAEIIVAGCMVALHKKDLISKFPNIHYFLGSGDVDKIVEAILSKNRGECIGEAKSYLQMGEVPRIVTTPKHYAYLKIAEGCKKRCSFCVIPLIKGKLRSKPLNQVIKEATTLINSGVKEIILIAQDLGDYGKDLGEKNGLVTLLKEILKIDGDYWIRLLYLYPDEITEDIIDLIGKEERICSYLDMPIQHINDELLSAMNRKTSKKQIEERISSLRNNVPGVVIRTSLMVGFPGESEDQFEELLEFVKNVKLDNIGIFKYSKEEQSHSATLIGHIDDSIKDDRLNRVAILQKKIVESINQKYIGKRLKVLIDGFHRESDKLLIGRFYGQCAEIDGEIIINDWRSVKKFGEFYDVEITGVFEYDLIGKVVRFKKRSLNIVY